MSGPVLILVVGLIFALVAEAEAGFRNWVLWSWTALLVYLLVGALGL